MLKVVGKCMRYLRLFSKRTVDMIAPRQTLSWDCQDPELSPPLEGHSAKATEAITTNDHAATATRASSSGLWWLRACADLRSVLNFIRLVFAEDNLPLETHQAQRGVARV